MKLFSELLLDEALGAVIKLFANLGFWLGSLWFSKALEVGRWEQTARKFFLPSFMILFSGRFNFVEKLF